MNELAKSRVLPFVLCAVSLGIGLFCGAVMTGSSRGKAAQGEPRPTEPVKVERSEDDHGNARALRARIRELEALLAEKGVEVAKVEERPAAEEQPRREGRGFGFGREEIEKFRTENPEQFAAITNGMAQWRNRRLDRAQSKLDFLAGIDTSKMSPAERKTHVALQEMIAKREELEGKMHDIDLSWDERRELFEQMRETDGQIRELNRAERDNLLKQTAVALGYQGDDASEIAETVKGIYEATDSDRGFGGRGGWNGGGRGGPGGGRGRGGPGGGGNRGGGM